MVRVVVGFVVLVEMENCLDDFLILQFVYSFGARKKGHSWLYRDACASVNWGLKK